MYQLAQLGPLSNANSAVPRNIIIDNGTKTLGHCQLLVKKTQNISQISVLTG